LTGRDVLNMLLSSLRKDIRRSMFPLMRFLLAGGIITFVFLVSFFNIVTFAEDSPTDDYSVEPYSSDYTFLGEDEYRAHGPSGTGGHDADSYSSNAFGRGMTQEAFSAFMCLFLPMLVILIILHSLAVTKERSSGTIRSYFHYPHSYRMIIISKTINVSVMTFLISAPLVIMAMIVFILAGESSLTVLGMGVISYIFVVGQYIFFVSLSAFLHKAKLKNFLSDPLAPMLIGNLVFIMMTESFILGLQSLMVDMFGISDKTPGIIFIRFFTPVHTFGELIDLIYLGESVSVLDFIWLPVFLAVVITAPILMKRIYPDIFIRETA